MRRAWQVFRGWPKWLQLTLVFVVVIVVIAAANGGSKRKPSASAPPADDSSVAPPSASAAPSGANIHVVASKSFCATTGIDDVYTGDGHVEFFLTFRNTGGSDGSAEVVPVRHYDDGNLNESAMDMFSVDVPAGSTQRVHTNEMVYKAHEHDIVDCGVTVNGGNEVPITVTPLSG